jgi:peroxiredoxin
MARCRWGAKLLSALILMGLTGRGWSAGPTPEDLLKIRPKLDGIEMTTPAEAEIPALKVEVIKSEKGSGYLLRDAQGRPLRRFFDSDGDRYIDVWSYFLDGQEVYREIDSNGNRKADQFRWLGKAGSKVGLDLNEDGRIDRWEQISPEEVAQEILQAVIHRDLARLQALMLTDADLRELQLPPAEMTRLKERLASVPERFNATTAALIGLNNKTQWMHVELQPPQCLPADAIGAGKDLIRYKSGTILYQHQGKADFLQTGEMILVGRAWKLVDAPIPGHAPPEEHHPDGDSPSGTDAVQISEAIRPLLDKLREVDESIKNNNLADPVAALRYNLARAAVLEQIIAKTEQSAAQENWIKQLADCLSAAAQNSGDSDSTAHRRLSELRQRVAKIGSSKLAGYVAYREMSADYTRKLSAKNVDVAKLQDEWRERLKEFVTEYPAAEDAPDALLQLGMVSEFMGKEAEARNWYAKLAKEYPASPLSKKAQGSLDRIELEGKPLELSGPMLGTQRPFDIQQLSGKVVVVYYWASWNSQCATDFEKLRSLLQSYKSQGLELVCISLDNSQAEAVQFLQQHRLDAIHLFQPGAMDSPLAVRYGILVLPNVFLVGRDGRVVSRTIQVNALEDEIKKLLK